MTLQQQIDQMLVVARLKLRIARLRMALLEYRNEDNWIDDRGVLCRWAGNGPKLAKEALAADEEQSGVQA